MSDAALYRESSLRESVLEHVFIGDLLRTVWRKGRHDIEVLRSEVDSAGYDLVLECNGVLRHVQLKSSYRGSKTSRINVNAKISSKPCGCVIWIEFDPSSLEMTRFLWLGGRPKEPISSLGDRIGRHTKGDRTGKKAERPNIRVLSKSKFEVLDTMNQVVEKLFGPI